MKKSIFSSVCAAAAALVLFASCGTTSPSSVKPDAEKAAKVAALIDAIYVQARTADTDRQCEEAKKAWDALTDAEKELVTGENAGPDYFGLDTGDASKDNPLNQDCIGENEILVVSFGTSFNNSRASDIGGVEKVIAAANPGWSVRRAFTSQIIINHIQARDGEKIDNVEQALERAVKNGVKNLVVQPTHLMHGAEYDELVSCVKEYEGKIPAVAVAEPLLGEVGANAASVNSDKEAVAKAITEQAVKAAGYNSLEDAKADGAAFVFLGHGTSHAARISYSQMASQMKNLGYDNVFVGTVEGNPAEISCGNVLAAVKNAGCRKVVLRPLMVVAGDHACNDMAGDDDDSWKSVFEASKAFDKVGCQIAGLGGIEDVQNLYAAHTAEAVKTLAPSYEKNSRQLNNTPGDGKYSAFFKTDSSMFRVNEACGGKGVLSVKNGKMAIHVSLPGNGILNLYAGLASSAKSDAKNAINPTKDKVTYSDGYSEEVNGFDIPVPCLGEEFSVAIRGKKGVWYDHKVSVKLAE